MFKNNFLKTMKIRNITYHQDMSSHLIIIVHYRSTGRHLMLNSHHRILYYNSI